MKKILNKTSVKLQENTNKMEEVKMATEKKQKRYQWTKGERFGDIVTVAKDQTDSNWLYFEDGSRINPKLIGEFLLEIGRDSDVLDVNVSENTQPIQQDQVQTDTQPIQNQVESTEPSIMGKMIMKMSKKNVVNVPLQINISIPTQQLYGMLLEGMEEDDLNEEIMSVALKQIEINNLTEYLKENISSFLSEYYSDN